MYSLTKEQLLLDLYIAFCCASRNKRNKTYVKKYESNLLENLISLRDSLWERTYKSFPSVCFIITDPKKREIFAANFKDRIVHHLYFNYTHKLFENTFIYDSYSCIKNKGTHFGIERMFKHIRQESNNYQNECYILKMDIRGYFMHIDRHLLYNIVINSLNKMKTHKVSKTSDKAWEEVIDIEFIEYLTKEITLLDPSQNCIFRSKSWEWDGLPESKSLFHVKKGCGLPIGNLTSQLYSNIYLNVLDQYIKRELKCKHYGRYVDDFYIISKDKEYLHSIIPKIQKFLKEKLHLEINQGKTTIRKASYGVEFLGAFLKWNRKYISNKSLKRLKNKLFTLKQRENNVNPVNSINSLLGILTHYKSYNIKREIFGKHHSYDSIGFYNDDYTKFMPYDKLKAI